MNRYAARRIEPTPGRHLHREVIEQIDTLSKFRELQTHKQWADIERDAKRYAAALLIPGESLVGEYGESVRRTGAPGRDNLRQKLGRLLEDLEEDD